MNSTEMMERFRQFAAADLFSSVPNAMNQVSEVLFEKQSVRIVLTRHEDIVEDIEVDVEIALPSLPKSYEMAVLQRFIDIMIATFEYLKCLISIGFSIELLQEEGMLVASRNLRADTNEPVFEVLGSLH